jgi:hypothetical protein
MFTGTGRTADARAALAGWSMSELPLLHDLEWVVIAALGIAAAGTERQQRECYGRLLPYAGCHVVVGGCASYSGPVDYHLGVLACALGRTTEAAGHWRAALVATDRLGAPAWSSLVRTRLGSLGRLDPPPAPALFRRDGETWTLAYAGREAHLPDAKGLRDLAVLLANPGTEIRAFALLGGQGPAPGADDVLDDRARQAYRRRLAALDTALERADARGDTAESERARTERSALVAELAAAAGLRGRSRHLGDENERARKAVSARVHDVLRRIRAVHPELAAHLDAAVSTGTVCSYTPPEPVSWQL